MKTQVLITLALALGSAAFPTEAAFAQEKIPVGMIYSTSDPGLEQQVREQLMITQEFLSVTSFDASVDTPALEDLAGLQAIMVWSDQPFANDDAVGDIVTQYSRAGLGVVVTARAFVPGDVASTSGLQGTFISQGLLPVEQGLSTIPATGGLGIVPVSGFEWKHELLQAGHPILWLVNNIDGGDSEMVEDIVLLPNAVNVAEWTNGVPAVITYEPPEAFLGRVVVLNLTPFPDSVVGGGYDVDEPNDMNQLLANSLLWAARWETLPDPDWCYNLDIFQDLNCNSVDVSLEEQPIDLTLDQCDQYIDPRTGVPYDNADYYWDIHRFGCLYPTLPYWDAMTYDTDIRYDGEGDWLSAGTISVTHPYLPFPVETFVLSCDNCALEWNFDQRDRDCDGAGDSCDLCIYQQPPPGGHQDFDGDTIGDDCDNCGVDPVPGLVFNPDQLDSDGDFIGDVCDNCPFFFNPDQLDDDDDTVGDVCDNCKPDPDPDVRTANPDQTDTDGDGLGNVCDNCFDVPNTDRFACDPGLCPFNQGDTDQDGIGDVCDNCPGDPVIDRTDTDQDGWGDACDNCDIVVNIDQFDGDADGYGNACDNCPLFSNAPDDDALGQPDQDQDMVGDICDNCSEVANSDQGDADADGVGNACDNGPQERNDVQGDSDEDGWGDFCDLCPEAGFLEHADTLPEEEWIPDPNIDSDEDGRGDACDNCDYAQNLSQVDDDGDEKGNACDRFALRGGGETALFTGCSTANTGLGSFAAVALAGLLVRRRRQAAAR